MRMLMIVRFPHEPFNTAVRDGSVAEKMNAILTEIKPESVNFAELRGQRSAVMIVNLDKPSMIPALSEPWFLTFNADVKFHVIMSPEDLAAAGLGELGKKWG